MIHLICSTSWYFWYARRTDTSDIWKVIGILISGKYWIHLILEKNRYFLHLKSIDTLIFKNYWYFWYRKMGLLQKQGLLETLNFFIFCCYLQIRYGWSYCKFYFLLQRLHYHHLYFISGVTAKHKKVKWKVLILLILESVDNLDACKVLILEKYF